MLQPLSFEVLSPTSVQSGFMCFLQTEINTFFLETLKRKFSDGLKKIVSLGCQTEIVKFNDWHEDDAALQKDEFRPPMKFSWQPCLHST